MKNYFKIGDKVRALVDKIETQNILGKVKCTKGCVYTICDVGEDYIAVDDALVVNSNDNDGVILLNKDEVELIK